MSRVYVDHAHRHLTGGTDPLQGLLPRPGVDLDDRILALSPDAFWKLDETDGDVAYDSSGNDHHLTAAGGYEPPTWGQPAGPPGATTARWADDTNRVSTTAGDTITSFTDDFTAGCWVKVETGANSEIMGQGTAFHTDPGWNLMLVNVGVDTWKFAVLVNGAPMYANDPLEVGTWYQVAVVRAAGTWKLYVDALLQAETLTDDPGSGYGANTWLGSDGVMSHGSYLRGLLSYAFIVDRPLSSSDLLDLVDATEGAAAQEGWVLGLDENGNPVWAPPGIEVTHGDGTPAEATATNPPALSGPTTGTGWHEDVHVETAVLYDSSPGRFDVPSRTWVRVPFNAVRIQRQWETTVDGPWKSGWLADDRGLTEQARNGVLHIADGMAGTPDPINGNCVIDAFYAIEYPVLDWQGLPDYDSGGIDAPDFYTRSARITNLSTGVVMRPTPGSGNRRFVEWEFLDDAAGMPVSVLYTVDNPYPQYPDWAGRPLTKPLPYPQLSPTDSLSYYKTPAGNPGFDGPNFNLEQNIEVGDNLCLQAWQDSPWPLRFTTDHFPNYTPYSLFPEWLARPYLAVTYRYDPDTVDHATGRLL